MKKAIHARKIVCFVKVMIKCTVIECILLSKICLGLVCREVILVAMACPCTNEENTFLFQCKRSCP